MRDNGNPLQIWRQTEGDTLTAFASTLKTADGEPVDLTDCTVRLRMVSAEDASVKIDSELATIDNAAKGQVSYAWTTEDVDTPGEYFAYWEVTDSEGRRDTYPHDGQRLQVVIVAR